MDLISLVYIPAIWNRLRAQCGKRYTQDLPFLTLPFYGEYLEFIPSIINDLYRERNDILIESR